MCIEIINTPPTRHWAKLLLCSVSPPLIITILLRSMAEWKQSPTFSATTDQMIRQIMLCSHNILTNTPQMHCCCGTLISSISSHDRFSVGKPQDRWHWIVYNTWTVVTREWVRGRQLTDLMTVSSLGSGPGSQVSWYPQSLMPRPAPARGQTHVCSLQSFMNHIVTS